MRNPKLLAMLKPSPIHSPHGKLATFFRMIMKELGYIEKIPSMIMRYHRFAESSPVELKNADSLFKEITSDTMTFKTFIKLLSKLLLIKKMRFTITLTPSHGKETHHTFEFRLEEEEKADEDKEETIQK